MFLLAEMLEKAARLRSMMPYLAAGHDDEGRQGVGPQGDLRQGERKASRESWNVQALAAGAGAELSS